MRIVGARTPATRFNRVELSHGRHELADPLAAALRKALADDGLAVGVGRALGVLRARLTRGDARAEEAELTRVATEAATRGAVGLAGRRRTAGRTLRIVGPRLVDSNGHVKSGVIAARGCLESSGVIAQLCCVGSPRERMGDVIEERAGGQVSGEIGDQSAIGSAR